MGVQGTSVQGTGVRGVTGALLRCWVLLAGALAVRVRAAAASGRERGDVPGWVLVTLMTAGLVVGLWAVAGPRLEELFTASMDRVLAEL